MDKKISLLVVGFGDRANCYLAYAEKFPERVKVAAVVDPDKTKLQLAKTKFSVPKNRLYTCLDDALKGEKLADAAINATMDSLHVQTTIPLLKAGYDVLLEKPVCNNKEELLLLRDTAGEYGRRLMICHVLRYTPYYRKIKKLILAGEVGKIMHIETNEHVYLAHASNSYLRGKWKNEEECGSTLLLAKCCHDIDLLCWLNAGTLPKFVSSFGSRTAWLPENAPEGAGTRCLNDCPRVDDCQFSVKSMYVENDRFPEYSWDSIKKPRAEITLEDKIESLKTDNPHGLCAYKTNANTVDHQSVSIEFANGTTAVHSLVLGTPRPCRHFHLCGTQGEIEGDVESGSFVLRKYDKSNAWFTEQKFDVREEVEQADRHAGGDMGIMSDFIDILNGCEPSVSYTGINESVYGHLCVYAADDARRTHTIREIK